MLLFCRGDFGIVVLVLLFVALATARIGSGIVVIIVVLLLLSVVAFIMVRVHGGRTHTHAHGHIHGWVAHTRTVKWKRKIYARLSCRQLGVVQLAGSWGLVHLLLLEGRQVGV